MPTYRRDIRAEAGYNPWGLVWLFDEFQNADTRQIPSAPLRSSGQRHQDQKRSRQHFRDNPSVFAKFNPDPKSATRFNVPKDAPEQFSRQGDH